MSEALGARGVVRYNEQVTRFLLICAGGALGTGARYALGAWLMTVTKSSFPLGTLAVNVIGSFAIAVVTVAAARAGAMSDTTRLVLTAGVLGGFTTYSSFNQETLEYLRHGAWMPGAVNVIATGVGCLVAGVLGLWAGSVWFSAPA